MSRSRFASSCLLFSALSLAPARASANGAFPAVSQIVADPEDSSHLFLRSTFGVVLTRDGGENWDIICESAAGYLNIEPPLTVLAGARVVLALPRGVSRSASGACEFSPAGGIEANVVDVSRDANDPTRAVAVSASDVSSQVWQSLDSGKTFEPLGPAFPDLRATTLDIAASDPNVLYVSGVLGGAQGGGEGVLLRSEDGGQNWVSFGVPLTDSGKKPYIAAIDARAEDTVYLRTTGIPGRLFVTRNGGQSFDLALELQVPIQGFALSPDGDSVLATNLFDGSYRADTKSLAFEKIACRGPSCLLWNEAGLFGCGDDLGDGFIVGRSEDEGETFERIVDLSCIRGVLACDASTIVGKECPTYWPDLRTQLGADVCAPRVVPPYRGCLGGTGGGGEAGTDAAPNAGTGAEAFGGNAGAANSDSGGTNGGSELTAGNRGAGRAGDGSETGPGCACSASRRWNNWEILAGLQLGALVLRRRATRARARPTLPSS